MHRVILVETDVLYFDAATLAFAEDDVAAAAIHAALDVGSE